MNRFLKAVQPNIDKFGIIAQIDGDGGDSILAEADLVFCAYIETAKLMTGDDSNRFAGVEVLVRFNTLVSQFIILDKSHKPSYGLLRRHPDLSRWYSHWDRGSRDQGHSIIAMALVAPEALDAYISNWLRRLFLFTTNTLGNGEAATQPKLPDFTGPGFWAYAIRCRMLTGRSNWLRPLLTVLDLSLVANSLIRVYWHGRDPGETDSRNHLKALGLSKLVGSTFLAKLARKLYKNMPIKFPDRPGTGPEQEVDDYFKSNGGVAGLAELWKPAIAWILE